ncbi:MAG: glutamine--fructose-6-phosphate transaminase (isomerizing) [Clostridium sp.]|nr:glutamine--fructose-6-phosphate transaminase (isomerizing) [Clostridium sp.]MCM1444400.1 glutamine--fructose-6-phosphate transaminase (isomerizing) [Candidatus Amulumruptor caecigallinarius]
MCGIIGYIGKKNAIEVLIKGLERLEYRGYDSAGIAYIQNSKLNIIKEKGKIENLKSIINFNNTSNLGIGHTRWATHGDANKTNSHPHSVGKITIVHNGIIENFEELKKTLIKEGVTFKSETDTEVACALLNKYYCEKNDIIYAIKKFQENVYGTYAIGIICSDINDTLFAIKNKNPLIIAVGNDENYIASDVPAILDFTNKYIILNDGEFAKITNKNITCYNKNGIVEKEINEFNGDNLDIEKNGYEHYMLKEINEQPTTFKNTVMPYLENDMDSLIEKMPDFSKYESIKIVACGSAMHAGLVGKNLIEEFADIPVEVDIASEFRYKKVFLNDKTLVIVISQSGETADSLAALERANENNCDTLGIINVVGSSIARSAKSVLYTKAGSEIAVATTKAYSSQVALLMLIALNIANSKNLIKIHEIKQILEEIKDIPNKIYSLLNNEELYNDIAKDIYQNNDIFYIGRDIDYALSMEGSLKLKEISYINSQAYAAGELKHGTISLIENGTPVIAISTKKDLSTKTISNIKEVKARGAKVVFITTDEIDKESDFYDHKIVIPTTHKLLQPLLTIIPLQMLSYNIAKLRGCDIDKPKNLAKSVTVE